MSDVKFPVRWDWRPDCFTPPFTILYKSGLDTVSADGEYRDPDASCVSIMGKSKDPEINAGGAEGKWFVVTGYDVPKGKRREFAKNMQVLVEIKYAQEKQNEF